MTRPFRILVPVLLCLLLAGCVSLPTSGQIHPGPVLGDETADTAPVFLPRGPTKGDSPAGIVAGFLDAMQANPLTTSVARKFLADSAATAWNPEAATIIYAERSFDIDGNEVRVSLDDVARLDRRGSWLGREKGPDALELHFRVTKEHGQWRVVNPPSALVIPETYFESRFKRYDLFFFDKTAQVLVPEPVYLPSGMQTPTLLVSGLLKGPAQDLLGVERSFIPASTEVDLSVPVSENGTVEVPLSDEVLDLDEADLRMVSAQLAWTLRYVQGVRKLRITVDGSPVAVPGLGTEQDIMGWAEFDPRVNWASTELFGLREGRVVTMVNGQERRVSGVFGSESLGIRSIGVDLPAEQIAAVTSDGTSVLVAPRAGVPGELPNRPNVIFDGGSDLLPPVWDIYGDVWLVDRTAEGAVVYNVRSGVVTEMPAPGITGAQVKDVEMSRDGTRLVAVVTEDGVDHVVVARVAHTSDGHARKVLPAEAITVGELAVKEIRDLAWRTPEDLALLTGPETGLSQVVIARVDGSWAEGDVASNPEVFRREAVRVATSPSAGVPLYVGTIRGQLFELAADGRWTGTTFERGLSSPVFVG